VIGIALLLAGAAVGFAVARLLQLPAVPFLLIAGLLLNLLGLLPEQLLLEDTIQLGLAFLVFAAGIELNPHRVGGQRGVALHVGFAQFVLLGLVGFATVRLFGIGPQQAVYLALAVAASSTLLVVRLLQQRKQMFEPFGRLVVGVLLLQDMLVIVLLPVLVGLPQGIGAAARGLVGSAILVGGAIACSRWLVPRVILRMDLDEEELLLATLALLFLFIGAAVYLGLPMIAGAFLAGFALSSFPVNGIVRGQLGSLSDFFLAIFFTALGGLVGIPDPSDLLLALALAAVVILLTPLIVVLVAERAGLSARAAIESGLLLAQTSEFSLVIVLQGWAAGHLDEGVVTVIVVVTMVTMFVTPFLATNRMTWRLMSFHPLRRKVDIAEPPTDHVLLIGCGDNGLPLLETLLAGSRQVVVIDDDPAVIEALREGDVECIRGDGSDFDVLRRAGATEASIIISTMRRPRDSLHVLDRVHDVPVLVRVFDQEDVDRVRRRGGIPISYAEAATQDFLAWLDQASDFGLDRERRTRPRGD
jgi:Kef-type K+ transport system membrane component KefB